MPLRSPKMNGSHLGVPTTGLVTEVATSLEQGANVNLGSHVNLLWFASARGRPPANTRISTMMRAPRRGSSRACVMDDAAYAAT